MSKTIVIAGGGWAGCAAAVSARRQGMDVILLERTDMLLGTCLLYTSIRVLTILRVKVYRHMI